MEYGRQNMIFGDRLKFTAVPSEVGVIDTGISAGEV